MELEVIENELADIKREIDVLSQFGEGKAVCISGDLPMVCDYVKALTNLKGHAELMQMALDRLRGHDV